MLSYTARDNRGVSHKARSLFRSGPASACAWGFWRGAVTPFSPLPPWSGGKLGEERGINVYLCCSVLVSLTGFNPALRQDRELVQRDFSDESEAASFSATDSGDTSSADDSSDSWLVDEVKAAAGVYVA